MLHRLSAMFFITILGVTSSQIWAAPLKCTGDGWEITTTDIYLTDAILTENGTAVENGILGCSRGIGELKFLQCSSGSARVGGFFARVTLGYWNDWEPLYDPQNFGTYRGLLHRRIPGGDVVKISDLECHLN